MTITVQQWVYVFMWDLSGRCWSTLPGRCDVYSAEVPSWPGALWLQQYSAERDNIPCLSAGLISSGSVPCWLWLCSGADLCPAGWECDESLPQIKCRLIQYLFLSPAVQSKSQWSQKNDSHVSQQSLDQAMLEEGICPRFRVCCHPSFTRLPLVWVYPVSHCSNIFCPIKIS